MAKRDFSSPKSPSQTRENGGKAGFSRRNGGADQKRGGGGKPQGHGYWLYGHHAVMAALGNPRRQIQRLLMTADNAKSLSDSLVALRRQHPFPQEDIASKADIDEALPPNAVHQGIAVLCDPLPAVTLEDIIAISADKANCVVMVLDQVTDPHNVGAIMRSAAAFGALAVVVPDRHSPDETGTLAKSASGALECQPLVRVTNVVRSLEDLKKAGFWIAGMAGEAKQSLAQHKLTGKIALVMGAEGDGLRRLTRDHCDYLVKLAMTGAVESLNVSNAAAVALYELTRDSQ